MPPQTTLKRQAGADVNFSNDDLDENEYQVTWGNKKSRYIYNYNLQSPDLFSNINDSDQTESVCSQLESTIEAEDEFNYSSDTCSCEYDSDCDYQNSSQSDTDTEDTEKEIVLGIDNGYLAEENLDDRLITSPKPIIPAFFKNCVKCVKVNDNPHYQYCYKCFKYRMHLFENNPNPITKKRIKHLNKLSNCEVENSSHFTNSQEPSTSSQETTTSISHKLSQSNTQESGSFGLSKLCMSNKIDKSYTAELCNICFIKPKDGIFNHHKTGHVYCCYTCAKHIWIQSGKCPICNLKIRYVTRADVV